MNGPDPELMDMYGTDVYYLEKVGFLPVGALARGAVKALTPAAKSIGKSLAPHATTAASAAGGMAFLGAARSDEQRQEELMRDAAILNRKFRMAEAQRMSSVVESLGGPGSEYAGMVEPDPAMQMLEQDLSESAKQSSVDPRMVKVAQAMGVALAHEMDKEALGFGSMLGAAKTLGGKLFSLGGKAMGQVGKGVSNLTSTGRMAQEGAEMIGKAPLTQRAGQAISQRGSKLRETGVKMQEAGHKAQQPKWEQAADTASDVADAAKPSGQQQTPSIPAGPPPAPAGAGTSQRITPGDPTPDAPTTSAPAPSAPAANKPLISNWTKAKIGLGAAGLAGTAAVGYGGYKGLQTARDYMMMPSNTGGRWGGYGPQMGGRVSPYGYVQPNF